MNTDEDTYMNASAGSSAGDGGLVLPWLDENLERLGGQENEIQVNSKLSINSSSHLVDEVRVLHDCLDYLTLIFREYRAQNDDELVVQQLGARIFNSAASGLRLAMSGYYQGAFFFARDLLEMAFLLDFFSSDPTRIREWRLASNQERTTKFGPGKIRDALDKRDGFTTGERGKRYRDLCEYAAHATYLGLKLLAPSGAVTFGPFFDERLLGSALEELTAEVVQASFHWNMNLDNIGPRLGVAHMQFARVVDGWMLKRKQGT